MEPTTVAMTKGEDTIYVPAKLTKSFEREGWAPAPTTAPTKAEEAKK